jgi:hypothetical protein
MRVTDAYAGDRDWLLRIFPDLEHGPDKHEHAHHDGCFYVDEHEGGRDPHSHVYDCPNDPHGPGRTAECVVPPKVAYPDKHRRKSDG